MRGNSIFYVLSSVISLHLVACGGGYGGDFGATPGGVKDLTFARELIAKGQIPPADALLVEAMFAEHDLGIAGEPCGSTLCLRAAAGFASELDETPRGWAQVGLSSAIDPETWVRPSTTFIFTVDVSGSMSWGDDHSPGELSRELLHLITARLRPDDRAAIVTYGSDVATQLGLTSGDQTAKIHTAIRGLDTGGSTNMEAGMKRAYALGQQARGSTEQVRVIVFTDVQPNVGATGSDAFNSMVKTAAAAGVHTTVLALGTGIGPEVLRAMASLRGANAFSLTKPEHVETLMTEEWPWFTTPIAYGLRVQVGLDNGWAIDRGLGFPAATDDTQVGLKAETVFLSRKKGALLVALESPDGTPAGLSGAFSLGYVDTNGTEIVEDKPFAFTGETPRGTQRTIALGLLAEAMHDAAKIYASNPDEAEQTMTAAVARFTADAEQLGDEDLVAELDLATALLELIDKRASQGTLYGY